MLRTLLLASPIVLFALVSCGDSSSSFDDVPADTAGTASSLGGSASGGNGSQAGSATTAGSSQGGTGNSGGTNQAGNGNTAGTKSQAGSGGQGGTTSQAGTGNNAGTNNQAGSGQGGTTAQAGTANAGTSSDLAGAGGTGDGGAGGSDGALCPDVFGSYEIKDKEGTCNGLNKDAPQTIEGTTSACAAHFVSTPASGAQGINGGADIDAQGNFKGSKLYLNETQRNPCNGTWNAQDATMTIECGGPADRCTVLLRRK